MNIHQECLLQSSIGSISFQSVSLNGAAFHLRWRTSPLFDRSKTSALKQRIRRCVFANQLILKSFVAGSDRAERRLLLTPPISPRAPLMSLLLSAKGHVSSLDGLQSHGGCSRTSPSVCWSRHNAVGGDKTTTKLKHTTTADTAGGADLRGV